MKETYLKKKLLKNIVVFLICTAVFSGFCFAMFTHVNKLIKEKTSLENDISAIQNQEITMHKEHKKLSKALEIYEKIDSTKLPSAEGYSTLQERIRSITDVIANLKEEFYVKNLTYLIGKRPELNETAKLEHSELYESSLKINFIVITDEVAHGIIDTIMQDTPGYLELKTFSLKRLHEQGVDVKNIENGQKSFDLLKGEALFLWKTLKQKNNENKKL